MTTCNPNQSSLNIVRAATDLFSDSFKDFWILSGSRLHHGLTENDYCLNLHSLEVDSRVGIQVTENGDLIFYANGTSMGAAACNIPTKKPIYCIFDIYGRTKVISKESFQGKCIKKIIELYLSFTIRADGDSTSSCVVLFCPFHAMMSSVIYYSTHTR